MAPRKSGNAPWILITAVVIPIITFFGGSMYSAFTIAKNIASVEYVDSKTVETRKYTDEKAAQILKEAFDHSDRNRGDMQIRLEQYGSDLKSQGVKIDMVLDGMRDLQKEGYRNPRSR